MKDGTRATVEACERCFGGRAPKLMVAQEGLHERESQCIMGIFGQHSSVDVHVKQGAVRSLAAAWSEIMTWITPALTAGRILGR